MDIIVKQQRIIQLLHYDPQNDKSLSLYLHISGGFVPFNEGLPGRIKEFVGWEELLPVENVATGEEADDVCDDLVRSPAVDRSIWPDSCEGL